MSKAPLVSVIVPTYNYGHFIGDALNSILTSTFPQDEIEILVIDDGSTDDSKQTLKTYEGQIRYFFKENSGKAHSTQLGINHSRGRYIFNLDADDLFLPEKILKVTQIFERDNDIVHVAHPAICWEVDQNLKRAEQIPNHILGNKLPGKEILSYFYKHRILYGGGSTFAARADVLKTLSIPHSVDMFIDEYLVLFAMNQGYSFFLEDPLSIWRIHGKNFSDANPNDPKFRAKASRSLKSMEAVLSEVSNADFDNDIKAIYALKLETDRVAFKEKIKEKKSADILQMWQLTFKSIASLGWDTINIIRAYNLFNRSLPTPLVRLAQKLKHAYIYKFR